MAKKLCEVCRKNWASVPDRNRMGRPINRICTACHQDRLKEDIGNILQCMADVMKTETKKPPEGG